MIRFVQSKNFSFGSAMLEKSIQSQFLKEEIERLLELALDWQADLVLIYVDDLYKLLMVPEQAALIGEALARIPTIKVIVLSGGDLENGLMVDESKYRNYSPNLLVLSEFETVFLEELGVVVHGGYCNNGKEFTYVPKLDYLDRRWPNFLLLPEQSFYNFSPDEIGLLNRFDYTTIHPWLSECGVEATQTTLTPSFITGSFDRVTGRWEVSDGLVDDISRASTLND